MTKRLLAGVIVLTACSGNVKMGDLGGTGGGTGGGTVDASPPVGDEQIAPKADGAADAADEDPYAGLPLWSPPGRRPYAFRAITYDERPAPWDEVGDLWGGWTDGTVQWDPSVGTVTTATWGLNAIGAVSIGNDLAAAKALMPTIALEIGVHAKGTGPTTVGNFSYDPNGTGEDLSEYVGGGVVFFAMAGGDPSATTLLMMTIGSRVFSPPDPLNPEAGFCGGPGQGQCYDSPDLTVQLANEWRMYIVPFQDFRQNGYGQSVTVGPALSASALVSFNLPKAVRFDFWISGMGFYRAKDALF